MIKSTIKELTLKANTVYDGEYVSNVFNCQSERDINKVNGILKYKIGLPVEDENKENFVTKITYYSKDSNFVKSHKISIGCYVINLAKSSKDYCHNIESSRYLMIMEDVVAIVVHEEMVQ